MIPSALAHAACLQIFEGNAPGGYITSESLQKALMTYGSEKLTKDQAAELVSQLEPDQNGLINYVEYVNMMMSD